VILVPSLATIPATIPAAKQVLDDPHPAWGGLAAAIAALTVFVVFATWIVVQRVRHGRSRRDD
jgi:hypothetical protein